MSEFPAGNGDSLDHGGVGKGKQGSRRKTLPPHLEFAPVMTTPSDSLAATVEKIRGSGSFFMKGSVGFAFPGISLPDGEELAFPLPLSQARRIESIAESAPYGKGEATVTDARVRHCRQIDADHHHSIARRKNP